MSDEQKKGFFSEFASGVKEGYEKQDETIRSEKEKMTAAERGIAGTAIGVVEGFLNPVRWLNSIFR